MAFTFEWAAAEAQTTILSTELNSTANGALGTVSAAVDNTVGLYESIVFEVFLASLTTTGSPYVALYLFYSHDGTNFEDLSLSNANALACALPVSVGTGAKRVVSREVPLLPLKFVVGLENETGPALASTLNTVKYRRLYRQAV